jgi:hypothetical protein
VIRAPRLAGLSPKCRDARDARCGYHELSRIGFWSQRLVDLRVLRVSLAHRGVARTLRKVGETAGLMAPASRSAGFSVASRFHPAEVVLDLQPGEWVEVKSGEEIRETLDRRGMFRGLYFMDEMWHYPGRRFRVLKRMERLMVERTGVMRSIQNTVLLEGVACDGSAHDSCDATCMHMWRELWLRRVDSLEPEADDNSGAAARRSREREA